MSVEGASRSFTPPKWCQRPRSPENRRQELRFVQDDGAAAVQPAVLTMSDQAVCTIGRADTADVRLRGEMASRMHAAILQDVEGRKFLVDLKSTYGTFLGGKRLQPHSPVRWSAGVSASFGSGSKAEVVALGPQPDGASEDSEPSAKRRREDTGGLVKNAAKDPMAALYGDLPDATVEVVPRNDAPKYEPLPVPESDPTKIIFLDVDGCLRPVHGRQDFLKNARTIELNGVRVPLLGSGEAKAGADFWPSAMRALRLIVQKTGARLVLSSDWRKEDVLKEGIAHSLEEYNMPPLYDQTPDLDQASLGVIKALHTSFREKRCKEIRKWLRLHPKVTRWVAIDDIDLSMPDKEAKRADGGAGDGRVFLDPGENFVRCAPMTGLTLDLARLAVCFLSGAEATPELIEAAYGTPQPGAA